MCALSLIGPTSFKVIRNVSTPYSCIMKEVNIVKMQIRVLSYVNMGMMRTVLEWRPFAVGSHLHRNEFLLLTTNILLMEVQN